MTPIQIVRESCAYTQGLGIKPVRGPWFVRSEYGDITHACALGSVLISGNVYWTDGAIPLLCHILNVDSYWIRRFWLGWDRGYQVLIEQHNGTYTNDDVSAMAIELAEELCKKTNS